MNQIVCIKKLRNLTGKGIFPFSNEQIDKQAAFTIYILEKLRNFNGQLSDVFPFYF